jgi:hypothetical protein
MNMAQEVIENTFTVPSPARFSLGNIRGSVEITAGEAGSITVKALKRGDTGDAKNTEVLISQAEDGSVSVETRYPSGIGGFLFAQHPCKVDYTVQVPPACDLKVSGVSNSAAIRGVSGDVKVSSVSGDLTLAGISGEVKVNAVSGKLNGEKLAGLLRVDTVSGAVRLGDCNFIGVEGKTVSGNIDIESPLGEGPYRFESVSGNVHLTVPTDSHFNVHSSAISGRFKTDLPLSSSSGKNGNRRAEVQGGGVDINHHSISGNLFVGSASESVAEPVQPETVPAQPPVPETSEADKRREILDRIGRGEINVDEALKLLS